MNLMSLNESFERKYAATPSTSRRELSEKLRGIEIKSTVNEATDTDSITDEGYLKFRQSILENIYDICEQINSMRVQYPDYDFSMIAQDAKKVIVDEVLSVSDNEILTSLDEAVPNLSEKEGTISSMLLRNKDKIDRSATLEELKTAIIDSFQGKDTPKIQSVISKVNASTNLIQLLQYVYNIILKGDNEGSIDFSRKKYKKVV